MRCRYWKICKDYRGDSETCNEGGGGSYCGSYRIFAVKEVKP